MKYILGILLTLVAIFIVGGTFLPVIQQEINYGLSKVSNPTEIKAIIPLDTDFGILIPKINANSHIIKNVDPLNSTEYHLALTKGVAHVKGSALPGQKGNIFLFSHSSSDFFNAPKINSVFYLLNKLELDDQIKLFYEGKEYLYAVQDKQVVSSDTINYLQLEDKGQSLTLMTSWPPGTSLKRLIVKADRK